MFLSSNNARKLAEEEIEKRRSQSRTYTEPLDCSDSYVTRFLDEFYEKHLFERGPAFKAELEKYSDSVGEHYKFLVPEQVSFDDFFSRYYYRCSIEYVMRELQNVDESKTKQQSVLGSGGRTPLTRSKSNDSILDARVLLRDNESRRGGRRAPVSRGVTSTRFVQSSALTSSGNFFMKEKPSDPISTSSINLREARNEMALKLLEEAKGRKLDEI